MRKIINFKSACTCSSWWQNQFGYTTKEKPNFSSVHGCRIDPDADALYHHDYPSETQLQRAKRLGCLDEWVFVVVFNFTAYHSEMFRGKGAEQLYKSYRGFLFGKQKKG